MMFAFRKVTVAAFLLVALAAGAFAASDWLTGSTDEKLKTLAGIQPGLGTVMIEYSNRYTDMYYAAKTGNWPWRPTAQRGARNPRGRRDDAPRESGRFESIRACLP